MKTQYTISVGKIGLEYPVDFSALPMNAQEYIIQRGFDHLNDVHAGIKASDPKSWTDDLDFSESVAAAIEGKIQDLLSGDISSRQGITRLSPIETILHRRAREEIVAVVRSRGLKVKTLGEPWMKTKIAETLAKHRERWLPEAERQVAAMSEKAVSSDDLGI